MKKYVEDLNFQGEERISDWPSWSPDGSQIMFSRWGDEQIWVINVDGTGLNQLTTEGRNCCPIWVAE